MGVGHGCGWSWVWMDVGVDSSSVGGECKGFRGIYVGVERVWRGRLLSTYDLIHPHTHTVHDKRHLFVSIALL